MNDIKQIVWTNFFGKESKLKELSDQHLSNILWFNEFLHGENKDNSMIHSELELELVSRNIKRLPWKPLPITNEIYSIARFGVIDLEGSIIGNKNCMRSEGKVIGSITHIKDWKKYLNKIN